MDIPTWIVIAKRLYELSKANHDDAFLPDGPLILFTNFKTAYDRQDTQALGRCVASTFQGDFYDAETKDGLIEVFEGLFEQLPPFASPNLSIEFFQLIENTPTAYEAIITFNGNLTVAGLQVPFTDYDAGRVACRLEPTGPRNTWQITKLDRDEDDE